MQGGDLPGWLAELFGPARYPLARRPARRMHPRRLPALAAMLRRAHDPPRPRRRSGGRQPCAGHGAGGLGRARRRDACRPATCSTRATTCSTRRTARSRPSCPAWRRPSCGAGCSGAEGGRSRARGLRRRIEELVAGRARAGSAAGRGVAGGARPAAPGWSARLSATSRRHAARSWAASTPAAPTRRRLLAARPRGRCWRGSPGDGEPLARGALECDLYPARPRACPKRPSGWRGRSARIAEPLTTLRGAARWRGSTTRRRSSTPRRATASRRPAARSAAARSIRCRGWQAMLRAIARAAARARHPAGPRPVPAPRPARGAATAMSGCTGTGSTPPCRSRSRSRSPRRGCS